MIPLSYSRISDFRQCRGKFKLKYLDKAPNFQIPPDKKGPHLVRGENVHKGLEAYVVKKRAGEDVLISPMVEIRNTTPLIDKLMVHYDLHPEHQIAVNEALKRVDWFSKEAWFRVIYDVVGFRRGFEREIMLGDYKTGKLTDYSGSLMEMGQLHFSAVVGMMVWPEVELVRTAYFYVDHKKPVQAEFYRSDCYDIMVDNLRKEHAEVNLEREWAFTKNQFCKWCDATKEQCPNGSK
jgi:hypothetical protein